MLKKYDQAHANLEEPTNTEKKLATAMHIASIFFPLWFPFVVWIVSKPSSKYISAHSWAAAIEGIAWKAVLMVLGTASLIWSIVRLKHHFDNNWTTFEWQEVIFKVLITLAVLGTLAVINFITAIAQARSAWKGRWPKKVVKKAIKAQTKKQLL